MMSQQSSSTQVHTELFRAFVTDSIQLNRSPMVFYKVPGPVYGFSIPVSADQIQFLAHHDIRLVFSLTERPLRFGRLYCRSPEDQGDPQWISTDPDLLCGLTDHGSTAFQQEEVQNASVSHYMILDTGRWYNSWKLHEHDDHIAVPRLSFNLQGEQSERKLPNTITFMHMPIQDGGVPSAEQLSFFFRESSAILSKGGAVGVHCWQGMGRTGTLMAAYLMHAYKMTPKAALDFVRSVQAQHKGLGGISITQQLFILHPLFPFSLPIHDDQLATIDADNASMLRHFNAQDAVSDFISAVSVVLGTEEGFEPNMIIHYLHSHKIYTLAQLNFVLKLQCGETWPCRRQSLASDGLNEKPMWVLFPACVAKKLEMALSEMTTVQLSLVGEDLPYDVNICQVASQTQLEERISVKYWLLNNNIPEVVSQLFEWFDIDWNTIQCMTDESLEVIISECTMLCAIFKVPQRAASWWIPPSLKQILTNAHFVGQILTRAVFRCQKRIAVFKEYSDSLNHLRKTIGRFLCKYQLCRLSCVNSHMNMECLLTEMCCHAPFNSAFGQLLQPTKIIEFLQDHPLIRRHLDSYQDLPLRISHILQLSESEVNKILQDILSPSKEISVPFYPTACLLYTALAMHNYFKCLYVSCDWGYHFPKLVVLRAASPSSVSSQFADLCEQIKNLFRGFPSLFSIYHKQTIVTSDEDVTLLLNGSSLNCLSQPITRSQMPMELAYVYVHSDILRFPIQVSIPNQTTVHNLTCRLQARYQDHARYKKCFNLFKLEYSRTADTNAELMAGYTRHIIAKTKLDPSELVLVQCTCADHLYYQSGFG